VIRAVGRHIGKGDLRVVRLDNRPDAGHCVLLLWGGVTAQDR
jgi:hypothetical protein